MRHTLTALLSAASIVAFAGVIPAAAQVPTIPSATGAPLYSYHHTGPVPAPGGECQIIAGNRVCFAAPVYGWGYGPGPYGYAPGGPAVAAPFNAAGGLFAAPFAAAGTLATAPVAATGAVVGAPVAAVGHTVARRTGTPPYSYESRVAPGPAPVGSCDIVAGNRVCP